MAQDQQDWRSLDKDINRVNQMELATGFAMRPLVAVGLALVFLTLAAITALSFTGSAPSAFVIVLATLFAGYMALNIGANDVGHTMGPAVGAGALSTTMALALAAVAETAGALLAGSNVTDTIAREMVAPGTFTNSADLVRAMLAALLAAALWLNLSTWLRAPVSTTHAIVGSVLGAVIAAAGWAAVDWGVFTGIALAWVASPLAGALGAVVLLALIQAHILYRADKLAAAQRWVPVFTALMALSFTVFLLIKSSAAKTISELSGGHPFMAATALGLVMAAVVHGLTKRDVTRQIAGLENSTKAIKPLFKLPLIVAATLMCFAHGANDVANAIAPLAAIVNALSGENHVSLASSGGLVIPKWVAITGALGLSCGVFLFGPRLISMVGRQITRLNPIRSCCVATATALIVILASWLGLPVSTTHVAIGGLFGVGFYREVLAHRGINPNSWGRQKTKMRRPLAAEDRKRRKLVRRSHFLTIVGAWCVTVPLSGALAALLYTLMAELVTTLP